MLRTRKITESDIEHVKTINLITYLERLGYRPEYKYAERAMFLSPMREENHPSFWVSKYNGNWRWKDWGTEEQGDIIKFVELYHGVGFLEAIKMLLEEEHPAAPIISNENRNENVEETRLKKVSWIRKFYSDNTLLLDGRNIQRIRNYFESKGVSYYPSMGCICYYSFRDKKSYIAIPIPFPEKIKGLECRELRGERKKTLGCKTLWVLKRDLTRILVAESILDALAGEIVLNDDKITLCSTNGICNMERIGKMVEQYRPKEVFFALDNDEPGQKAQEKGIEIARPFSKVRIVDEHIKAGVKDLHKLLVS
ncbi:MAG: toprim domain-containing protein [Nitrospirota bacterium]